MRYVVAYCEEREGLMSADQPSAPRLASPDCI
jgi:hypothetical protein